MPNERSFAKRPLSKNDVQPRLAEAWSRVISKQGKGAFADRCGCCTATVDNALTGPGLPEVQTLLNSLLADPSALDEVFALYNMRLVPCVADAANDLQVISGLNDASSEWLQRILDGKRCHRDTAALAKLFRPLIAKMQSVVEESEAA